jgi:hypothetical protein
MTDKDDRKEFMVRLTGTEVRVSYPRVFRAEAFRGSGRGPSQDSGAKKFSCVFMIPKDSAEFEEYHNMILDTIDDALEDTFGKNVPKIKAEKWCYRDGDEEEKEEYHGHWILSSSSTKRPKVVDVDGETPLAEEDGKPYGGCYCLGWVRIWIQDNEYGKRVNGELKAVQFIRDGEAFGGQTPIDDGEFKDRRDTRGGESSRDRNRSGDRDRGRDRDEPRSGDRDRTRDSDRDAEGRSSRSRRDDDEADEPRRRRSI